jgi:hypothetical protein
VSVKRNQNSLEIVLGGSRMQRRDQSLVSAVNAIELSDGHGGWAQLFGLLD